MVSESESNASSTGTGGETTSTASSTDSADTTTTTSSADSTSSSANSEPGTGASDSGSSPSTSTSTTPTTTTPSPTEETASSEQCGFKFVDECSRHFIQGDCKECRTGFVLDRISNTCVRVRDQNQILNCLDYINDKCVRCSNGYFLQENKCIKSMFYETLVTVAKDSEGKDVKTTNIVPLLEEFPKLPDSIYNCEVYEPNDPRKCQRCDKGYYLTSDFSCSKYVDFPNYDPNCASVTTFRCFECQSGYALVNNSFLDRTFSNLPLTFPDVYSFLQGSAEGYMAPLSDNSCLPESIPGCLDYSGISTCKVCKSGYTITRDKGCERVSSASEITYCKEYLNDTKCLECQKFFKLSDDNTSCLISKFIENCKEPKGDTMFDGCLECEEGYFNANGDVCRLRSRDWVGNVNCLIGF